MSLYGSAPLSVRISSHVPWPIEDTLSTFLNSSLSRDKWNGNLLGRKWLAVTHVVSVDETTMAATIEEVCFEVNSSWKDHWAALCNTSMTHSSVNQHNKPWFCEILRDTFRDGCQCLRTSVDYLIFLITLQVFKCARYKHKSCSEKSDCSARGLCISG